MGSQASAEVARRPTAGARGVLAGQGWRDRPRPSDRRLDLCHGDCVLELRGERACADGITMAASYHRDSIHVFGGSGARGAAGRQSPAPRDLVAGGRGPWGPGRIGHGGEGRRRAEL